MLRKLALFIYSVFVILFCCNNNIVAQDTAMVYHDTIVPRKVLIIPFQNKMYMSDASRDMSQASKLDLWTMVAKFKSSLNGAIKQQLVAKGYIVETLEIRNDNPKEDNDLKIIERSASYRYIPVPHPKDKDKKDKKGKVQKPIEQQTNNPLASYLGGKTTEEEVEKYMTATITSKTLFPYLLDKYHFDYIIFLNQFEIHNAIDNTNSLTGPDKRQLKVHYTLFGKNDQQPECSNVSKGLIPIDLNKVDDIIKLHFGELTKAISNCLPDASLKHDQIKFPNEHTNTNSR